MAGQGPQWKTEKDDALEDGQYYLQFFNNNLDVSASTTNDFDYEGAGIGESGCSYYYVYLVDENEGTFALADSLEVPYSGYASSVQWKDGNLIVDSGTQGLFTEYDADYAPIRSFSMGAEKFIYRVFKYNLRHHPEGARRAGRGTLRNLYKISPLTSPYRGGKMRNP